MEYRRVCQVIGLKPAGGRVMENRILENALLVLTARRSVSWRAGSGYIDQRARQTGAQSGSLPGR